MSYQLLTVLSTWLAKGRESPLCSDLQEVTEVYGPFGCSLSGKLETVLVVGFRPTMTPKVRAWRGEERYNINLPRIMNRD